ncbi:MAG: hypothetical protein GDA36_05335 [Rhodobacteraceae bacterium]|nr:hypothetical protein [Paracoccaceae bacterium]
MGLYAVRTSARVLFLFLRCIVWISGVPVAGFLALDEGCGFTQSLYAQPPGQSMGACC